MKRIGHLIEYGALRIAAAVFMCLPLGLFYRTVRTLGHVAFDVLHLRRAVAMRNLRAALGDRYDGDELVRIARAAYGNIAITFAEIAVYPRLKPHVADMVDPGDMAVLDDAFGMGHGVIVVTCHYGSWEFLGNIMSARGIPVTAVGKTQSNARVDRFLNERRAFMGVRTVARGAQVKRLVQALRGHGAVILVSDQDAGRRGIFAPFFGMMASTPSGAAQLALRYRVPIVVAACERTGDGRYRLSVDNLPVRVDDTAETVVIRMNEAIEAIIRRHPEQYLWMHRRWKTSPPESAGLAAQAETRPAMADRGSGS